LLLDVCQEAGFHVVSTLVHSFSPHGVTCALVLAESHFVAHSWPEYAALVVDLYSCGETDGLDQVVDILRGRVGAQHTTLKRWPVEIGNPGL
jgi:hypothetical protein